MHARNAFLTTLGLLLAVALVAIASRGSTPAGTGDARGPGDTLLDILFTLYLLGIVLGAVLAVYMLTLNRHVIQELNPRKRRLASALAWLFMLAVAALAVRFFAGRDQIVPPQQVEEPVGGGLPTTPATTSPVTTPYEPEVAWVPVLVTLALIVVALAAWWYAGKARRRARGESPESVLAGALVVAVDESLDDLRAEPDPRRAVIAAYARLERVLASQQLPRRPSEAPLEYLSRILERLSVRPEAVQRLTALFERAKFSQHAVYPEMKDEAITALEHVRDDLAAARALAEQERAKATQALLERAAK